MNLYALLSFVSFLLFFQAFYLSFFLLKKSKERTGIVLFSLSFSIYSFFSFLIQVSITIDQVYLFDRLASAGWTTFPVWTAWLLYLLSNSRDKGMWKGIWYLLFPLAVLSFIRYNIDPESIKQFFFRDEVVFNSINRQNPWFYIFVFYLFSAVFISVRLLVKWQRNLTKNRERRQVNAILIGTGVFVLASIITNLLFPFLGNTIIPSLAQVTALPMGVGLYLSVVNLRPQSFSSDVVSRLITNHLREFVFYFDQQEGIYSANRYCLENLRFNSYELMRMSPKKIFGDFQVIQEHSRKLRSNKVVPDISCKLFPRTGDPIPVILSMVRIDDYLGNYLGFVLLGLDLRQKERLQEEVAQRSRNEKKLMQIRQDLEVLVEKRTRELMEANERLKKEILERKRAEQQISSDLEEKVQLVKEIHHRVKNNIQIIISLTNMMGTHKDMDIEAREKVRRIAERIRSISSIHEEFYASPNLSRINFSDFIKNITGEIYANQGAGKNIIFRLNVGSEFLEIDQAIPCGIIYSELLTNALRHAFPPKDDTDGKPGYVGTINVEFYKRQDEFTLLISDNGIGLDGRSQNGKDGITGLGLVEILVKEHLKGSLTRRVTFGTSYILKFNN
ncbi:MAG: histidine kinase dimerization/phosphoacceptor domain -containing protein [Bacteroidales bacterium]|jgi:two-component sensor histidine kinase|nr:histidine kinase dimerization/phosphoacceptor domain -containing protein [Bacteroidales bacterium]